MCSFTVSPFDFSRIFEIIKGCTVYLMFVSLLSNSPIALKIGRRMFCPGSTIWLVSLVIYLTADCRYQHKTSMQRSQQVDLCPPVIELLKPDGFSHPQS